MDARKQDESAVRATLRHLPHPLPRKTTAHYMGLVGQIVDLTEANIAAAKLASLDDLAAECASDARRMLRNVATFMVDAIDADKPIEWIDKLDLIDGLSQRSANQNFGGIGTNDRDVERNKQWAKSQGPDARIDGPTSGQQRVFAAIARIDSLIG
ncbi:hypothetical protein [Rosistilla oblonga]|uniref:hypothetical protein n=1 Tax=Rosistilla oblonga TaxID=2527990 RepID=UPI003A9762FF